MTTRAKFRCNSVEMASTAPTKVMRYAPAEGAETTFHMTWRRTYRFQALYDTTVPEDQRYAQSTPSGSLTIVVDNPAVTFEPGRDYYLDFTLVDPAPLIG